MITLEDAVRIATAAEKHAQKIGQPMNIAIVDGGGNLKLHHRMDDAWLGSIDISINKAFTARAFDISTKDLAGNAQPGQQFYGIQQSNHGRVMIFAGGVPLRRDGKVVGAVGISGGSGEQDQSVAEAAAAAFEQTVTKASAAKTKA
ncbi:Protein glcG [Granulibacter bethesdensis]|uniref:Protein glcG n=1 Tax=Granulibacter bethesdensis TaxID=364410 RepID=A0AAC9KDG7_9PROT|nr:heme-binding protein [Granulibacter bethesdensis]APH54128.1 Protein glcG [Granulibacter bethesdensis]APH61710.1 Protein glcG [Granulibacter bethesdensis]